jgi:uncharacterized Zn finger protein
MNDTMNHNNTMNDTMNHNDTMNDTMNDKNNIPIKYCCNKPDNEVTLKSKLHQSRGIVQYDCQNCGETSRVDYYLSHKIADGKRLRKDSMLNDGECNHYFAGNQKSVLRGKKFIVISECKDCGLVVKDVLKQM